MWFALNFGRCSPFHAIVELPYHLCPLEVIMLSNNCLDHCIAFHCILPFRQPVWINRSIRRICHAIWNWMYQTRHGMFLIVFHSPRLFLGETWQFGAQSTKRIFHVLYSIKDHFLMIFCATTNSAAFWRMHPTVYIALIFGFIPILMRMSNGSQLTGSTFCVWCALTIATVDSH